MTFEELQTVKIRRGDIVAVIITYKGGSFGPSTWSGPVISTQPIVLFPYSGNNGYEAITKEQDHKYSVDYHVIHNPFYVRWFLFIGAMAGLLRIGKR